jgi:hypothetical protein
MEVLPNNVIFHKLFYSLTVSEELGELNITLLASRHEEPMPLLDVLAVVFGKNA